MFPSFNNADANERLRQALLEQEAEDAELKSILTDKEVPQSKINEVIASALCRIRVAQVYQNHNSALIAERLRLLNINLLLILAIMIANMLWGQQLSANAILSEIAKLLMH